MLIENNYLAGLIGILRSLKLIKKQIYLIGDWFPGSKIQNRIWHHLGSNLAFPFFDFLACKFSDVVLNNTSAIIKSRYNFWGRRIAKKEIIFKHKLEIKIHIKNNNRKRRKIVFFGSIRQDSGLDLVIPNLNLLASQFNIKLIIIGGSYKDYYFLHSLINEYQAKKNIEFLGFLERDKIKQIFNQCFCGINLLTSNKSHSLKAYPGKIYDYLQYLLPVLATKGVGFTANVIEKNRLGLIIKPKTEECMKAIINIYHNQGQYRQNIIRFLNSFNYSDIKQYLKL